MSERKITIPLNTSALGGFLMTAGLALAVVECFIEPPHHVGWVGIVVALIGKQLLNRCMLAHVEHQIEHQADVQIHAFELGKRTALEAVK